MRDCLKGTLYANNSNDKQVILITFEFDSLKFINNESGEAYEVSYDSLNIELGGYENRLIMIKAVSKNKDLLLCYIDENCCDDFLNSFSRLNLYANSAKIEKIRSKYRISKIKLFIIEWAEWIIALIIILLIIIIRCF